MLANGQHPEPECPLAWLSELQGYTQAPVWSSSKVLIFLPQQSNRIMLQLMRFDRRGRKIKILVKLPQELRCTYTPQTIRQMYIQAQHVVHLPGCLSCRGTPRFLPQELGCIPTPFESP